MVPDNFTLASAAADRGGTATTYTATATIITHLADTAAVVALESRNRGPKAKTESGLTTVAEECARLRALAALLGVPVRGERPLAAASDGDAAGRRRGYGTRSRCASVHERDALGARARERVPQPERLLVKLCSPQHKQIYINIYINKIYIKTYVYIYKYKHIN